MAGGSFEKILSKLFFALLLVFGVLYAFSTKYKTSENRAERGRQNVESARPAPQPRAIEVRQAPRQERATDIRGEEEVRTSSSLRLDDLKICRGIAGKDPFGISTAFPDSVKRLFCYTVLSGGGAGKGIRHVWFHQNVKRAEVKLEVQDDNFRTWSSKRMVPEWTGLWRVEILDEDGVLLGSREFEIRKGGTSR